MKYEIKEIKNIVNSSYSVDDVKTAREILNSDIQNKTVIYSKLELKILKGIFEKRINKINSWFKDINIK
jgi:hypothetical protein